MEPHYHQVDAPKQGTCTPAVSDLGYQMPDKDMLATLGRGSHGASTLDVEAESAHGYAGVLQALGQSDA